MMASGEDYVCCVARAPPPASSRLSIIATARASFRPQSKRCPIDLPPSVVLSAFRGARRPHHSDCTSGTLAPTSCATINYRMPTGKLHIVPLGGLGEFGMNCMAVRWGDDIIVIDGGLMFPEAELLGVDIVVPDISYLTENRQRVKGIILTHGHEDHIGALPWILSELNVPVWGTEFTLAYVEDKLEEHGLLDDADLREIRPGEGFK